MAAQIGIELSAGVCRIVDVHVRRSRNGLTTTRVRRFSVFPQGTPETATALAALRGQPAAVVVWGVPGDHRQVMVTAGSYDSMRREARRALALAGVETRGAMLDIARAPTVVDAGPRQPVVVALANGSAVRAAVEPLRAAGIEITTLATPATALVSLARARRRCVESDSKLHALRADGTDHRPVFVDAYVAIEESGTCITLLRDGALVASRELSWGFQTGRRGEPRRREDIACRLVDEFASFMTTVGGSMRSVRRATLCGGAPDLHGVATIVAAQFDVDVVALDAPFGIDDTSDAEAVNRCADLWMAWAVAVDARAPLSLVHPRHRKAVQTRLARVAIAAGIVAGIGLGYEVARPLLRVDRSAQREVVRRTPAVAPSDQMVFRENDE